MDVLVLLEEKADANHALAHVQLLPATHPHDVAPRDVVTLYGAADADALAMGLAAAVEAQRAGQRAGTRSDAIRHLGVFEDRGAVGDAAWRDEATGQLVSEDLDIPLATLRETATRLLLECGSLIRQMVAGLSMPDWPEGMRRAINFSFVPAMLAPAVGAAAGDALLDSLREADGDGYDFVGD